MQYIHYSTSEPFTLQEEWKSFLTDEEAIPLLGFLTVHVFLTVVFHTLTWIKRLQELLPSIAMLARSHAQTTWARSLASRLARLLYKVLSFVFRVAR